MRNSGPFDLYIPWKGKKSNIRLEELEYANITGCAYELPFRSENSFASWVYSILISICAPSKPSSVVPTCRVHDATARLSMNVFSAQSIFTYAWIYGIFFEQIEFTVGGYLRWKTCWNFRKLYSALSILHEGSCPKLEDAYRISLPAVLALMLVVLLPEANFAVSSSLLNFSRCV